MLKNKHTCLFLLLSLFGCKHDIALDAKLLKQYAKTDKGLIFSCIRCKCMDDELEKSANLLKKYKLSIYADSSCLNSNIKDSPNLIFISQGLVDSLYERNYNIILFDLSLKKQKFKLIKTEEALEFENILVNFFELNE